MPILSIIIPSYNISKYIDECVPFFIDERFEGLIEIFFIDDGATDNTVELLHKYADAYPKLFKIIEKENSGHGSVINYALDNCISTKYFKVIDGDDWIDKNNLFDLCQILEHSDYDLIVSDFIKKYPDKSEYIRCFSRNKSKQENDVSQYLITIHSSTFKTELFQNNNIRVRERVFYDDNEYVLFPLPYIKTILYHQKPIYFYRLGNSSQSVSSESMKRHFEHACLVNDDIAHYFDEKYKTITNDNGYVEVFCRVIANFQFKKMVLSLRENIVKSEKIKRLNDIADYLKKRPIVYRWLYKNNIIFNFMRITNYKFVRTYRFLVRSLFR